MTDIQSAVEAAADRLDRLHYDGTGCGVPPQHPNACSNCYGPTFVYGIRVEGRPGLVACPRMRSDQADRLRSALMGE